MSILYTATYSPEDNKLRLYASQRLDAETYARVKAAGFGWAPKQELFVAPMWTPERAALCEELAGEIGDEDTSLVARAEERAGRFDEYSDKRAQDSARATEAVRQLADGTPFGQPILVGHHSERHARKDAERIENGMRKAVKMWKTSEYWTSRAAGALQHAKYKERPDVRARRIKKLEADERKQRSNVDAAAVNLRIWTNIHNDAATTLRRKDGVSTTFAERALYASGSTNTAPFGVYSDLTSGKITAEEAQSKAIHAAEECSKRSQQWLDHYRNRLAYERAMLAESGGTATDQTGAQVGGACQCWASPRGGWSYIKKVNKVSVTVADNWGNGGRDFTRTIPFDKLTEIMTPDQVKAARNSGELVEVGARGFVLSSKPIARAAKLTPSAPNDIDAMRASLKAGVSVAVVPQLFPTPADVAAQMVKLAGIESGHRVLEPSAGTGVILDAIKRAQPDAETIAVEVSDSLSNGLLAKAHVVHTDDFLQCNGNLGMFDRILMNPPFENGADIKHIRHAVKFLKPGGRLVAICADGPRQNEHLRPLAEQSGGTWEQLSAGTFKNQGTNVNTAMLVIEVQP